MARRRAEASEAREMYILKRQSLGRYGRRGGGVIAAQRLRAGVVRSRHSCESASRRRKKWRNRGNGNQAYPSM